MGGCMNSIQIENLTYEPLFDHLNLEVQRGSFLSLVGRNGCGKSVLIKILLGLISAQGTILIDGFQLNKKNKRQIRKKIGVVFENPDSNFVAETPREDMSTYLRNLGYSESKMKARITEVAEQFGITEVLDYSISNLSGGEKQIIALATVTLHKPSILILDDAFSMVDGITKEKMIKIIKRMNREEKMTVIQITHDMDDTLYGSEIAIIDSNQIILHDKKEKVFEQEKLLKRAGLELPFMASLSLKLQFYDLIDTMILDMDKMVNVLWK